MSSLSAFRAKVPIKMLLLGDSGTAKTGSLASLALAGYKLRIVDMDNGLEPLYYHIAQKNEAALAQVAYETCTDTLITRGSVIMPKGMPDAAQRALKLLDHFKTADGEDYGKPSEWDHDTVLVLDSLTFFWQAAMRQVLAMNGRSGQHPWQQDWGQVQSICENLLAILYSAHIKCHVIVMAHITYQEIGKGIDAQERGYPAGPGKALNPRIGRYFNSMIQTKTKGIGSSTKRILRTAPEGLLDLKTPKPGTPNELPIETGLATLFESFLGTTPGGAKSG